MAKKGKRKKKHTIQVIWLQDHSSIQNHFYRSERSSIQRFASGAGQVTLFEDGREVGAALYERVVCIRRGKAVPKSDRNIRRS